jgi:TolB protein
VTLGGRSLLAWMLVAGALVGVAGAVMGCKSQGGHPWSRSQEVGARPTTAPSASVEAPAAKLPGISLFGDLPSVSGVPFEGQASSGLQQHTFTREGADFDPDVDRTGRLLVFASTCHATRPNIYVKAVGESALTQLTDDPASHVQPRISPDGKSVAYASDRSGNWDIWITSIDGQNTQQVTKSHAEEVHPDWASDGRRLVYCALNPQNKQWELWVVDLRQTGTKKFLGAGLFPRWSPKEDVIVYQRARARGNRLFGVWTIRLIDGEPRFPTEVAASPDHALIAPAWSADGSKIVYCSVEVNPPDAAPSSQRAVRGDIWMTDVDGRGKVCLTKGDAVNYSPVCGVDGRIYFASNRSGSENIWSVVPIKPPAPVADARSSGQSRPETSP